MNFTTEILSNYLGKEASALLADAPFRNWAVTRSVETDLDKLRTDYVFTQDGFDFASDEEDKVDTIFLYSDQSRCFKEGLQDLPFTSSRQEVIARLGSPSKSGARRSHPILGERCAWDRFSRPGYVVHVEYRLDADGINKITLMRADVVP